MRNTRVYREFFFSELSWLPTPEPQSDRRNSQLFESESNSKASKLSSIFGIAIESQQKTLSTVVTNFFSSLPRHPTYSTKNFPHDSHSNLQGVRRDVNHFTQCFSYEAFSIWKLINLNLQSELRIETVNVCFWSSVGWTSFKTFSRINSTCSVSQAFPSRSKESAERIKANLFCSQRAALWIWNSNHSLKQFNQRLQGGVLLKLTKNSSRNKIFEYSKTTET